MLLLLFLLAPANFSLQLQHLLSHEIRRSSPESPRWLVSKDRDAEAKEVLKLVYPEGYNVDIIARKIKENIAAEAIAEHAMGW